MNQCSAVVLITVAVGLLATTANAWPFALRLQNRLSVEQSLLERIEQFRRQMPCGIDGGPPLAPFELAEQDLALSLPGTVESTGTMRNLSVNGLDGFNVDYLTFTLFRLRLEYSITLPVVRTSGVYNLNATLLDAIDLWGAGPFEFNAFNINVNGFIRFRLSILGQLSVVEMESLARVDRIESRFGGILGSDEGSEFYNGLIEQLLPDLLASNQRELSDMVSSLLLPILNEQLSGMTLADFMAGDANERELPCVVDGGTV